MTIKGIGSKVLDRRNYPAGQLVVKQGDIGSCAYLVQTGLVKVYTEDKDRTYELARLGPGQIFGEMALVMDEPRSASVIAVEDSNIVVISRDQFINKLDKADTTVRAIVEMLMKRLSQTNQTLLKRDEALDEVVEISYSIYQAVYGRSEAEEQVMLEENVLPHLTKFMDAVKLHLAEMRKREQAESTE